jgi:hypothetical protein
MIWHWMPLQVVPPPPGQTWLAGQAGFAPGQVAGQSSALPQPLPIWPQYWPPPVGLQVIGTQLGSPQTFAIPVPAQVDGGSQAQSTDRPQPSPIFPQYLPPPGMLHPCGVQLAGTHTPSELQVLPAAQSPH